MNSAPNMSGEDLQEATAGYRVLFMLKLSPGADDAFLRDYEAIRWQVAQVPGHMSDQVCRSANDADEWLITSEWRSAEDFLAWESTPGHREGAMPILVLTASGGPAEWRQLSAMGVDGFLVKPVMLDDVIALVRRSLQKRSSSPGRARLST